MSQQGSDDYSDDISGKRGNVTLSSLCGNGACIGIEQAEDGSLHMVNVREGKVVARFGVTDSELDAFVRGATVGDFNHLVPAQAA